MLGVLYYGTQHALQHYTLYCHHCWGSCVDLWWLCVLVEYAFYFLNWFCNTVDFTLQFLFFFYSQCIIGTTQSFESNDRVNQAILFIWRTINSWSSSSDLILHLLAIANVFDKHTITLANEDKLIVIRVKSPTNGNTSHHYGDFKWNKR